WAVRLLGDRKEVSPAVAGQLSRLASVEPHLEVRGQLASTAKRLPATESFAIISNLLKNHNDVQDPDIPLLVWWALESKAISDREELLALFGEREFWDHPIMLETILHRLMQRYIMEGGEE